MSEHPCPTCGAADTRVIDSRPTHEGGTRRRRTCRTCKKRWSTLEVPLDHTNTNLAKLSGKLRKVVMVLNELIQEIEALTKNESNA